MSRTVWRVAFLYDDTDKERQYQGETIDVRHLGGSVVYSSLEAVMNRTNYINEGRKPIIVRDEHWNHDHLRLFREDDEGSYINYGYTKRRDNGEGT